MSKMLEYTAENRGHFLLKVVDGELRFNEYDCEACKEAGREHSVLNDVPHGLTDESAYWGSGIPTTRRECTTCHCWDGPWVSTDIVGGGW